ATAVISPKTERGCFSNRLEATGRTFYERSGQQFANDRAVADATRRAANEAAAALAAQLQVYLKNNPAPSSVK
ncbi:MAG: hypothetical protein AAFO77_12840, partial [Pseudomonadota bacterium]